MGSPFNNIYDEVRNHPMTWVWSKMPWFDWFFTKSLKDSDIGFETYHNITVIDCPIMILHAEDDAVVPFELGKALYETAQQSRGEGFREVHFQGYSADLGYAHKYICRDPNLPDLVRSSLEKAIQTINNHTNTVKSAFYYRLVICLQTHVCQDMDIISCLKMYMYI